MDKIDKAIKDIEGAIERLECTKAKMKLVHGLAQYAVLADAKIEAYRHCIDILKELKEGL